MERAVAKQVAEQVDAASSLEKLGKLLAGASGFALALSVLYDYCYLQAMGLSLAEVPTSIADHVRSAIIWAPVLLGTVVAGIPLNILFAWSGAADNVPPPSTSRADRWVHLANRAAYRYIPPLVMLPAAFFYTTAFFFMCVAGLAIWVIGCPIVLDAIDRKKKVELPVWLCVYALPLIAAAVCMLGNARGTEMRDGRAEGWLIVVKDGDATKTIPTKGLRRFGETVVFVESDRRVQVLPASVVVSASIANIPPLSKRAACEFLEVYCKPLTSASASAASAASASAASAPK